MDLAKIGFQADTSPMKQAADDVQKFGDATQKAGQQVEQANASFDKGKASVSGFSQTASGAATEIEKAGSITQQLDAIVAKTGVSYAAAAAQLKANTAAHIAAAPAIAATATATASVTKEVEAQTVAFGGLRSVLGGIPSVLGATALGFGGLAVAGGIALLSLAKVSDEVERTKNRLSALTGSQEQGNRLFSAIKDTAQGSGVALNTLESAVEKASQGFNIAADRNVIYANSAKRAADQSIEFAGALKTVGQILQLNLATSDEDKKVIDALSSSIAETGTITVKAFQTIRDQSPGTALAIAKAFGKDNVNEFQRQLALTPIPLEQFEQVLKRIAPAVQESFNARPIDTVKQATEELSQEWSNFKKTLAETGAVGVAKDALIGLTGVIKTVTDGDWLKSTSISDAINKWLDSTSIADIVEKWAKDQITGPITNSISSGASSINDAIDKGVLKPINDWLQSTSIADAVSAWAQTNIVGPVVSAVKAAASAIASATSNPGNVPASGNPAGDFGGGNVPNITAGGVDSSITAGGGATDYASAVGDGTYPAFASGTDSAPGGPALINEQGGEIVNLPSGSQVIPHDLSVNLLQGNSSAASISDAVIQSASVKQITDAISQSTIDIAKQVQAGSDQIVNALNKIAGGGSSVTTNPATGLPVASSSSSSTSTTGAINPLTGQPITTSGGGGGGGFSFKADPNVAKGIAQAKANQAATNAQAVGAFDPMYSRGLGLSVKGAYSSAQKNFPAGAPINPMSTVPVNQAFPVNLSSTGYPGGMGGNDARSSLDYGSSPYDDYGSGLTFSATGSTVFGASSGGDNYSSDYGGSSISGIFGNDPNTINYGGGSYDAGYFAGGGALTVPGAGGVDNQTLTLHTRPGEEVNVLTPEQLKNGGKGDVNLTQNFYGEAANQASSMSRAQWQRLTRQAVGL